MYMEQHQGFIDPLFSNHVCKHQRVIFELKQVLRAWFDKLKATLLHLGFLSSKKYTFLFMRIFSTSVINVLV